jgi:hypothetical protein
MCAVHLEQVYPSAIFPFFSPSPPTFSNSVWWAPLCRLHVYVCNVLPSSSPLSSLSTIS